MWRTRERYRWMIFLFLGGIGLYASRVALPISSVSISTELKWNKKETGFVLGVFFWGYAMTQFLAGYLSDRLGGEKVISFSAFLWSMLTILFAELPLLSSDHATVYTAFVGTRFLLGVFQGFYYPSLVSLMSRRVQPAERNFTHSVLNAGTHMGTLLCGSLGSYIVTHGGWRALFVCVGMAYCTWSFLLYVVMIRPQVARSVVIVPIAQKLDFTSEADPDIIKSKSGFGSSGACTVQPLSWIKLLTCPAFWAMLFANFVHNNSFYVILNWGPTYFHDNYPDARSWIFNMVPWLIIFPSVLLSGYIADRWVAKGIPVTYVRKAINTVVLLGSAFFILLLSWIEDYYIALLSMALALACLGFHSSGVLLNPQDIAPNHGGQLYGIMATVGTIPGFVGVFFVGYLLDTTRQWSIVFLWTALFSIVGWVVYTLYGSSEPRI